jgi:hypothetical protein
MIACHLDTGSLRFDGMGSVLMDPNVLSHTRTVELRCEQRPCVAVEVLFSFSISADW